MNEFAAIVGDSYAVERDGIVTLAPAATDEVAAVLRLCTARGWVVSPQGGGTKQAWGNPVAPSVILDTRRLAGIREHVWQDLTATVGAGTTWAALQQALGKHGQRVALDPLFAAQATVGGIVAVNDSGSLRMRYGSLRDLLIGMTVVLADGTVARSGGKVVKNVAGYDLPKLFNGSFGTLGIITQVTFRLHPAQPHEESWTVESGSAEALLPLQQQLLNAAMSIESLQLRSTAAGFALDVRFAALPEVLREHELRLRDLCGALSVTSAVADVWQKREQLFADASAAILKITALPNQSTAILQGFRSLASSPETRAECVSDAAGITTVALHAPQIHALQILADLRARLRSSGGMVVVLRTGDTLPPEADRWGGSPPAIAVMRAVKHEFDPQRLLNPGRFVGGI